MSLTVTITSTPFSRFKVQDREYVVCIMHTDINSTYDLRVFRINDLSIWKNHFKPTEAYSVPLFISDEIMKNEQRIAEDYQNVLWTNLHGVVNIIPVPGVRIGRSRNLFKAIGSAKSFILRESLSEFYFLLANEKELIYRDQLNLVFENNKILLTYLDCYAHINTGKAVIGKTDWSLFEKLECIDYNLNGGKISGNTINLPVKELSFRSYTATFHRRVIEKQGKGRIEVQVILYLSRREVKGIVDTYSIKYILPSYRHVHWEEVVGRDDIPYEMTYLGSNSV